jgi:hypothetical protein
LNDAIHLPKNVPSPKLPDSAQSAVG